MPQNSSFGFFSGAPKGRQKIRRYARRLLQTLPAHRRLDPKEKMLRKLHFRRRKEEDDR